MYDDTGSVSIVVPVCNEAPNVRLLAQDVAAALRGRVEFELIFVDDGSTDGTGDVVRKLRAEFPEVRLLRHARRCGQSAAVHTGVRQAHAEWVATLDGDGQNDPADLPAMLATLEVARRTHPDLRLVAGHRVTRRDTWLRRLSSRIANRVRSTALGDASPDTGCGIKLLHRDTFLLLPYFDHMHRFLPALFQRHGASVISVPVAHRPRLRGRSKYGVHNRLWVGLVDLMGVIWLMRRGTPGLRFTEE